ncbi:pyridoxal phosphate-dependent aminotransferase [Acidihalobacter prosperus]|uniref:Aminotransferase n=1 Tax=Acidihalobacter prosperus TaxID=160660 RepID=A0A1A6C8W6_9GAMM|nr:pyridoxal phosphate-dependent aminotransferase [Acidihalobacter prosperus]OBS11001.1 aspartate aminotransferase [Acidihalobacter prosperus]
MDIQLAQRVQRIKPSPTLAVTAFAAQLKAEGRDIISLSAGEPDFDTPAHIQEAAIEAMHAGQTRYTAVDGTGALKAAIIGKFRRDNSLAYTPEQILVSNGAKQSFYNLCEALLNPGDEVVIPAPYWVSYPDIVLLADATPVPVLADQAQGFKITPTQLEASITTRTRLLVLNSPSNPTGATYTATELAGLGEVLKRHPQIIIASDDIYEPIVFGDTRFTNLLNVCPELADRTVVMNGVSKAYAMTGWRIGYAAGPKALIGAMKKIQSQSTSNPNSIAQAAAAAALDGDQACVETMRGAFEQRQRLVSERLNAMPGIDCLPSSGTFYAFPNVVGAIERLPNIEDDIGFAQFLLDEVGVAVVPGSAFGAPGHIRLSFATSMANLEEALRRIATRLQAG